MTVQDETLFLAKDFVVNNNEESLERAIKLNSKFIDNLVKNTFYGYRRSGQIDYDDLNQEGILGFIEGIRRFDFESGNKLLTYVSFYIKKFLQVFIEKHGYLVYYPASMHRNKEHSKFLQFNEPTKSYIDSDEDETDIFAKIPSNLFVDETLINERLDMLQIIKNTVRDDIEIYMFLSLGYDFNYCGFTYNQLSKIFKLSNERIRQKRDKFKSRLECALSSKLKGYRHLDFNSSSSLVISDKEFINTYYEPIVAQLDTTDTFSLVYNDIDTNSELTFIVNNKIQLDSGPKSITYNCVLILLLNYAIVKCYLDGKVNTWANDTLQNTLRRIK